MLSTFLDITLELLFKIQKTDVWVATKISMKRGKDAKQINLSLLENTTYS
jgi:hypothetical protein